MTLFTVNPEVMYYAKLRMIHVVGFMWLCNFYEIPGGVLRGMGYSILPAVIILLGCCVLRIIWVYAVLAYMKDFAFLMNIYPVSWLLTGAASLFAYYYIRKKLFTR